MFFHNSFIYMKKSYKDMQIKQLLVICAISYLLKKNTDYLGKSHSRKALQKEAGNLDFGPLS